MKPVTDLTKFKKEIDNMSRVIHQGDATSAVKYLLVMAMIPVVGYVIIAIGRGYW